MLDTNRIYRPWLTDEGSTRVTEMRQDYNHFSFPGNPFNHDFFGPIGIYLRRE